MSWLDGLGFCASFAVLASFCMTTIVPLRLLALTSNVLFSTYGLLAHIYPVAFLHLLLLPINLVKLYRIRWQGSVSSLTAPRGQSANQVLRP
jgi:CRP/FNR family transcriptional regulator, cyclic AMP receptor protein